MILDTSRQGYRSFLKIYEYAVVDALMIHEELSGAEAHAIVVKDVEISKTSVMDCLNRLVEEGLVKYREESMRGGPRRMYRLLDRSWASFHSSIVDKFLYKLWEIFPDCERIIEAMKT